MDIVPGVRAGRNNVPVTITPGSSTGRGTQTLYRKVSIVYRGVHFLQGRVWRSPVFIAFGPKAYPEQP